MKDKTDTVLSEADINDIFGIPKEEQDNLNTLLGKDTLFNKESHDYIAATTKNVNKRVSTTDPLNVSITQATHLDDKQKERYLSLAEMYTSNMEDNIFKDQFELAKDYPGTTRDEWNDFLSDRIVSVYINKHKRTMLKNVAELNLANPIAKNKRDNLKLIENLQQQEASEQNKNICIIRIPDIYDE